MGFVKSADTQDVDGMDVNDTVELDFVNIPKQEKVIGDSGP